jgi:hypothetical protein
MHADVVTLDEIRDPDYARFIAGRMADAIRARRIGLAEFADGMDAHTREVIATLPTSAFRGPEYWIH